MSLTAFEHTYTINHDVAYPAIVAANKYDTMEIVLGNHPVTGEKIITSLTLDSTTNPANESVWSNATNVAYSPVYDQITGNIFTLGPVVGMEQTYILRNFCMTLDGAPNTRSQKLHVYVSGPVTSGGGDPDDGSWTGDTN